MLMLPMVNKQLYRKNGRKAKLRKLGGVWAMLLTDANAKTLTDFSINHSCHAMPSRRAPKLPPLAMS